MSTILDTNAVSALLAGDAALAALLEAEPPALPVIVVGEYRFGLTRSRLRLQLGPLLDDLIAASQILRIDLDTTSAYVEVRQELRDAGRPIPENDVWIAALSRQHRMRLISRDRHFDAVAGLVRLSW
ncbi:MAG: type II toxin-antitoxin system VapC family toxin [Acidobacteria bacterium]|nr:MAG: type II toxin-antitoxin system VapC family toxin [Acidobacteriota bacterium]REK11821.1 MAG: type II toxin-antitoxin system VapC family toxin [Acidobacteriota bacterium]